MCSWTKSSLGDASWTELARVSSCLRGRARVFGLDRRDRWPVNVSTGRPVTRRCRPSLPHPGRFGTPRPPLLGSARAPPAPGARNGCCGRRWRPRSAGAGAFRNSERARREAAVVRDLDDPQPGRSERSDQLRSTALPMSPVRSSDTSRHRSSSTSESSLRTFCRSQSAGGGWRAITSTPSIAAASPA